MVQHALCCSDCKQENWNVRIIKQDDGKTLLVITCATPGCSEQRSEELGIEEGEGIVCLMFDITGQEPKGLAEQEDILPQNLN